MDSGLLQAILTKETPEVESLLADFQTALAQLQAKLAPMLTKLQSNQVDTTEHGLSYLELKYNLLASYCQFLSVFLLLKLEGGITSLATHPVVDRLLYLKTLLERLRPLDQKLQYQVDKLLRTAALAESGVALDTAATILGKEDGMLYKANIENMVGKD